MDLLNLRETYLQERILLCFNGPISHSLIEELGNALRNYLQSEQTPSSEAMDVFAVYIEMTQNIRHYARTQGYSGDDAAATIAVARTEQGRYQVSAGNLVEAGDARGVLEAVEALDGLDAPALKRLYKQRLRQPRESGTESGAGLGLLDMARKSSAPLQASLTTLTDSRCFFTLTAEI